MKKESNTQIRGNQVISSEFCSGNAASVEAVDDACTSFELRTAPDCAGQACETNYRTWFHFSVTGAQQDQTLQFAVLNLNPQSKMFVQGMKPSFRVGAGPGGKWERVPTEVTHTCSEGRQFRVSWRFKFSAGGAPVFFAFTPPYSYEEVVRKVDELEAHFGPASGYSRARADAVYFERETLVRSLEGRRVELLTITDVGGMSEEAEGSMEGCFPDTGPAGRSVRLFPGKTYFLLSARVHPGEAPAQWMWDGLMDFLLSRDDPRARALRANFVFKVVPVLNPDGVARGHYRADTQGLNLNRFYDAPDPARHPTIWALRALAVQLAQSPRVALRYFVDLHAHATKRGCFCYANALPGWQQQLDNLLFARLIATNAPHFDYSACIFSEKAMESRDKNGQSKEGCSRVGIYRATGLTHCITVECNYNSGRSVNHKAPAATQDPRASPPEVFRGAPPKYGTAIFREVGRGVALAALDMGELNPWSRVACAQHKSLAELREWVKKTGLSGTEPYRGQLVDERRREDEARREEARAERAREKAAAANPPVPRPRLRPAPRQAVQAGHASGRGQGEEAAGGKSSEASAGGGPGGGRRVVRVPGVAVWGKARVAAARPQRGAGPGSACLVGDEPAAMGEAGGEPPNGSKGARGRSGSAPGSRPGSSRGLAQEPPAGERNREAAGHPLPSARGVGAGAAPRTARLLSGERARPPSGGSNMVLSLALPGAGALGALGFAAQAGATTVAAVGLPSVGVRRESESSASREQAGSAGISAGMGMESLALDAALRATASERAEGALVDRFRGATGLARALEDRAGGGEAGAESHVNGSNTSLLEAFSSPHSAAGRTGSRDAGRPLALRWEAEAPAPRAPAPPQATANSNQKIPRPGATAAVARAGRQPLSATAGAAAVRDLLGGQGLGCIGAISRVGVTGTGMSGGAASGGAASGGAGAESGRGPPGFGWAAADARGSPASALHRPLSDVNINGVAHKASARAAGLGFSSGPRGSRDAPAKPTRAEPSKLRWGGGAGGGGAAPSGSESLRIRSDFPQVGRGVVRAPG